MRRRAAVMTLAALALLLTGDRAGAVTQGSWVPIQHAEPAPQVSEAAPIQPTAWVNLSGSATPEIVGWPNALRISGGDDYSASLAVALMLRGSGTFPYGDPDPGSRSPSTPSSDARAARHLSGGELLAASDNWWGTDVCPRSVIVVAADLPADALAATPLSDPTGLSTEPLLVRTASASPFIAPVGETARVDTDNAPILLTASARAGAAGLSDATALAVADLRSGGCTEASAAIIVGGTAAVPSAAERQLLDAGYFEVFRVAGSNRYSTAATIATALGTQPLSQTGSSGEREESACHRANQRTAQSSGASEPWVSTTGNFYANAAIEWHRSANECEVLARTVVIADGLAGVDALAAGPFMSYWQVPVLLHDGSPTARDDTLAALEALNPFHVLVLGGDERISQGVLNGISAATDAEVIRLAGADRYETAIEIAKHLGGWWPSDAADQPGLAYTNAVFCVAASTSSPATTVPNFWQHALVAAPLCGSTFAGSLRASAAPSQTRQANSQPTNQRPSAPPRALTSVDGTDVALLNGTEPRAQPVTPLLLTDASDALHPALASYLAQLFRSDGTYCGSTTSAQVCVPPGFAYVFGPSTAVSDAAVTQLSAAMSGTGSSPVALPTSTTPFVTALDMSPLFTQPAAGPLGWSEAHLGAPSPAACWHGDAHRDARWLTAVAAPADGDGVARHAQVDLARRRPAPTGATSVCVELAGNWSGIGDARRDPGDFVVTTRAVSAAGRASPMVAQQWSPAGVAMSKTLTLTGVPRGTEPAADQPADDSAAADPPIDDWPTPTTPLLFGGSVRGAPLTFPTDTSGLLDAALGPERDQPLARAAMPTDTLVTFDDTWSVVAATAIEIVLAADTFRANYVLHTARGNIVGTATGDAHGSGPTWHLRGVSEITGATFASPSGTARPARGGFVADLRLGGAGAADDVLTWRFDAQSHAP